MARIKWNEDYGNYKAGQEYDVADTKSLKKHIEAGRIEILKVKPETATVPEGENAMLKPEKVHTRKTDKK
jgi:hypothetical protein